MAVNVVDAYEDHRPGGYAISADAGVADHGARDHRRGSVEPQRLLGHGLQIAQFGQVGGLQRRSSDDPPELLADPIRDARLAGNLRERPRQGCGSGFMPGGQHRHGLIAHLARRHPLAAGLLGLEQEQIEKVVLPRDFAHPVPDQAIDAIIDDSQGGPELPIAPCRPG